MLPLTRDTRVKVLLCTNFSKPTNKFLELKMLLDYQKYKQCKQHEGNT